MKTKLIKDFLEKCAANNIYVGLHGTDTNLCLVKEYCKITGYDALVVKDKDEIAYERIIKNGLPPFLQDKSDPFQALCEMNRNRREIFRKQADFILEIAGESTPESTAEKILAAYKENLK